MQTKDWIGKALFSAMAFAGLGLVASSVNAGLLPLDELRSADIGDANVVAANAMVASKTDICLNDKFKNKLCAHIEKVSKDPKHANHYDVEVKFVAHCGTDKDGCDLMYHLHGKTHHIADLPHDKTLTKTMTIHDIDPSKSKAGSHDLDIDLKSKTAGHGHIELDVVYDNGKFHFVQHP